MNLLIKILVTAGLVLLIANFMPGVHVAGFTTALIVAMVSLKLSSGKFDIIMQFLV